MIPTNVFNLSDDTGRTFEIEVTGSTHHARLRTSSYKVKVPYSALSTTINSIGQRGGKIVDVKMLSLGATAVASVPALVESQLPIAETTTVQSKIEPNHDRSAPVQHKNSKSKRR
jgi:phycocyanin-associated, rod